VRAEQHWVHNIGLNEFWNVTDRQWRIRQFHVNSVAGANCRGISRIPPNYEKPGDGDWRILLHFGGWESNADVYNRNISAELPVLTISASRPHEEIDPRIDEDKRNSKSGPTKLLALLGSILCLGGLYLSSKAVDYINTNRDARRLVVCFLAFFLFIGAALFWFVFD